MRAALTFAMILTIVSAQAAALGPTPPATSSAAQPTMLRLAQTVLPPATPDGSTTEARAPAQSSPGAIVATPSAAPPRIAEQDLTALRYYIAIKNWPRVEAEIRRLRVINPTWEPPADLMTGQAGLSLNEQELWDLFGAGRYADARARLAQLQQAHPSYIPSADLLRQLDIAEAQQHLGTASEGAQWQAVIDQARQQPNLLSCARTDTVWRTAEAFARLQQMASAFGLYRSVVGTCSNLKERIATLQKANAFLSPEQMTQLYALARDRSGSDAGAINEVQKSLEAGRRAALRGAAPRDVAGPARAIAAQASAADAAKQSGAFADCLRLTETAVTTGLKLTRAWCLYELDRPTEASLLFAAVRSQGGARSEAQDATYGLIFSALRRGLVDDAQAMIDGATLTDRQHREVQDEVLAQLSTAAYQRGDYRETLRLFDARDQEGALPRRDLRLLRGFALYNLHRYREALDVFLAVDRVLSTPNSREGVRIARGGLYGFE